MAPDADVTPGAGIIKGPVQPSGCEAMPSEGIEGDEWGAYVTLGRTTRTNAGSPAGREPQGDGVPIVVVGVTDPPRRAGKPPTGRRGTGDWVSDYREVCVMQSAETVLDILR